MDLLSARALFTRFLDERRYLNNVTTSTLDWYGTAFKAFNRALGVDAPFSKANLHRFVMDVRQRGVKPVSCNTDIKALNAFCVSAHQERHHLENRDTFLRQTGLIWKIWAMAIGRGEGRHRS